MMYPPKESLKTKEDKVRYFYEEGWYTWELAAKYDLPLEYVNEICGKNDTGNLHVKIDRK